MWPLAMSFTDFMTDPSIEEDLDERDLKALSVVSIWVLVTGHSKQSG